MPLDPRVCGIDTASVAGCGPVNWTAYKQAGYTFAIVRATYGVSEDPWFARYWAGLGGAGVRRGAYMFWQARRDPEIQARRFCEVVGEMAPGDMLPVLDVEFPGGRAKMGLTARQALERARAAWQVLRDCYGKPPIVYTSARVWREDLGNLDPGDMAQSALWLAWYKPNGKSPPLPPGWSSWQFWQWAGNADAANVPGFRKGKVDWNRTAG